MKIKTSTFVCTRSYCKKINQPRTKDVFAQQIDLFCFQVIIQGQDNYDDMFI